MSIKVVVADDQAMIREALAALLDMTETITVVGQAGDGQQLLDVLASLAAVDVAVVDIEMPVLDGLTTCAAIRRRFPQTKVLIVTTFGRPGYVRRALEAGAGGFIVKDASLSELSAAIQTVHEGGQVIDPALAAATLKNGESPLTPRETEVLALLYAGKPIGDISAELGLSRGTVRNYVSSAIDKTGTTSRGDAARVAAENGWLEP